MRLGQRPRLRLTILALLTLLTLLGSLSACGVTTIIDAPPPPIPQSAVTLGGSVFAFDKKYGASNCCYLNGWTYQGPFGQKMWTGVNTDHTLGGSALDESSSQRVIDIENYGPISSSMNITMTQAKSLCGSFLPSDAQLQHTITVSRGGVAAGSELTYTSTLLANTLPTSDFTDKDGKVTPPGTFFVNYDYSYIRPSGPLVAGCGLATAESLLNLPA
jgi:hypothetical protein